MLRSSAVLSAALLASSCAQGQLGPVERNTAVGTAAGAAVGAAVAEDETTGALIGGALGAAAGAYTGCRQQGGCFVGGEQVDTERQYDASTGRYYFYDPRSGNTYYANGDLRTRGQ